MKQENTSQNPGVELRTSPSAILNPPSGLRKIVVGMGEGIVTAAPHVLTSIGLGSCVAVMVYAPRLKVGGMAHIMLPAAPAVANAPDAEYGPQFKECSTAGTPHPGHGTPVWSVPHARCADTAITSLLARMRRHGAAQDDLVVKMAGGAKMFSCSEDSGSGIGDRNVMSIRRILTTEQIPLAGEDVGGRCGRSVEFYLETGKVIVVTVTSARKEI